MQTTKQIGDSGEDLAVDYLVGHGYHIIERNYHNRYAEIDIVALDEDVLSFVEVKRKSHDRFGSPAEMITDRKLRKITGAAQCYIADRELGDVSFRIDAVLIDGASIELVQNVTN